MSVKGVMERWAQEGMFDSPTFETDFTPRRPGPEVIALIVAWDREMKQLSVEALASLANVSVSTIERIERCEPVSRDALRDVAVALGREEGAFVDIRTPLTPEEAMASLERNFEWIEGTVAFPVRPLRTQRQVREIADCAALLVDAGRLHDGIEVLVQNLRDYLELASLFRAKQAGLIEGSGPVKMRAFYGEVIAAVQAIERAGYAVALAGTYEAKLGPKSPMAGQTVTAGVVSFFPKRTDPCAIKRKVLRGPEIVEISFDEPTDLTRQ